MYKVYSQDGCSYCELAKITLMERNIEFEEINIKDNAQALAMLRLKNLRTIPQIWFGELYIGGYTELKEHIKKSTVSLESP